MSINEAGDSFEWFCTVSWRLPYFLFNKISSTAKTIQFKITLSSIWLFFMNWTLQGKKGIYRLTLNWIKKPCPDFFDAASRQDDFSLQFCRLIACLGYGIATMNARLSFIWAVKLRILFPMSSGCFCPNECRVVSVDVLEFKPTYIFHVHAVRQMAEHPKVSCPFFSRAVLGWVSKYLLNLV